MIQRHNSANVIAGNGQPESSEIMAGYRSFQTLALKEHILELLLCLNITYSMLG